MDVIRFKNGLELRLEDVLLGLDAGGNLWVSMELEDEPLAEEDLHGFLGRPGERLGEAMAAQARRVLGLVAGSGVARAEEPPIRQVSGRLVVPATRRGEEELRFRVPFGVLAIGSEGDVWRPGDSNRLLWSPTWGGELSGNQVAEVAMVAWQRWTSFREEMVEGWVIPMASRGSTSVHMPS